ncbi:hypothetical protein, variant [Allomyces macrogynus ATCC 38327]|uniref:Uncharacterized protein n=1 Tax=Allomyces macrogynus (strain ATCC 38327) TaxID=578462 RepID=A0A0L0SZV0_ALLM3|nr:hypothetical protein, variant [Allomyces macrogynus ATCC 38327]|eukprot:KNE68011.1 hypothetical protein, variant [Allomyces macrogynus ATCC 38327]
MVQGTGRRHQLCVYRVGVLGDAHGGHVLLGRVLEMVVARYRPIRAHLVPRVCVGAPADHDGRADFHGTDHAQLVGHARAGRALGGRDLLLVRTRADLVSNQRRCLEGFSDACSLRTPRSWISNGWAPYRMYFFYNAIIGCFILNLIMYVRVGMEIWRVFNEANTMGKVSSTPHTRFHARYRFAIKCSMYLAVFVLVYGFALANRVETLVNPDNPLFALAMLHGIMFPLKGTLNALVYFSSHLMARVGGILYHSGDSTDGSSGQKTGTSASASHSASHSRMEFGLSSRTGNVPLTGSIASQTPRPPASPAPMRWPESDIKSAGGNYAAPVPTFEKPRPTYGSASPAPPGGDGSGQGGRGGAGGAPQRPMYF